jgi:diguanylate cyclase (GGDEF)-like protein
MSQPTILHSSGKSQAQVIALDARRSEPTVSAKKQIEVLKLSDLLSRNLQLDQIIAEFAREIQSEIPHQGYRFECSELETALTQGKNHGCNVNYSLTYQGKQLGEITLYRLTRFGRDEIHAFENLLCALVFPVKNALMYQNALQSAYCDPLTGLNNRTSMEKNLPREIDLANRHGQPMALMVMDLDGFKQINDSSGHDAGDQVLLRVGQVMTDAMRNTDLLYRYGGDEFVGGLPQTDVSGAMDVSERIRSGVERLDFSDDNISSQIYLSLGLTMVRPGDSYLYAFKRADRALYNAKQSGKNRIVIG